MSETMQPPGPAGTTYIHHERRQSKSISVWMDKDEAEKLYACRASLRDCLDQMERTPKSSVSPDFIAAITNARKALEEQ